MAKSKTIILGENKYNADALRSVTEQQAVLALKHKCEPNQIRNAWKQANGLSVRNYAKNEASESKPKTKRKRTTSKKDSDK